MAGEKIVADKTRPTTFGFFLMKLTYEDKIQIYQLRKQGFSLKDLSKIYNVTIRNLDYLVQFIDRFGIESVKKGKKRSKNFGARIKKRRLKSSQKKV